MQDEGEVVRAGFERKYRIPESDAAALLRAVGRLLAPDPHGSSYDVASLYLDTVDLASYRRALPGKWRLRRYGAGESVYAEFKARPDSGDVRKRRTALTLAEGSQLPAGERPRWFLRAIAEHGLRPVRVVSYRRQAYVGELDGDAVRLTLDRDIVAAREARFCIPAPVVGGTPLTDGRILELKFQRAIPPTLEAVVTSLGLLPESFSKYRAAIEELGDGTPERHPG